MSTLSAANIFRTPGRLAINPTNLSTGFPHGGTAIGVCNKIRFIISQSNPKVRAEEFGGQAVEAVFIPSDIVLACNIRSKDNDAIETLFSSTATGASGNRVISWPGSTRAGMLQSSRAVSLIFTPENTLEHPAIIIYNALPLVSIASEMRLSILQESVFPAIFLGLRDGTSRVAQMGILGDLTL